jgi:hypothetical protein
MPWCYSDFKIQNNCEDRMHAKFEVCQEFISVGVESVLAKLNAFSIRGRRGLFRFGQIIVSRLRHKHNEFATFTVALVQSHR